MRPSRRSLSVRDLCSAFGAEVHEYAGHRGVVGDTPPHRHAVHRLMVRYARLAVVAAHRMTKSSRVSANTPAPRVQYLVSSSGRHSLEGSRCAASASERSAASHVLTRRRLSVCSAAAESMRSFRVATPGHQFAVGGRLRPMNPEYRSRSSPSTRMARRVSPRVLPKPRMIASVSEIGCRGTSMV
jgi:hypothetical protein